MKCRVVTLMDNRALEGFESEHGLAIYVEAGGVKILFDTGQSGKFIENAEKLIIDLRELDYVVLSHGHYDHSGGVENLTKYLGENCKLIVGEGFFAEKYKLTDDGECEYIGNPFKKCDIIEKDIKIRTVSEDMEYIEKGIVVFKNFENRQEFEKTNTNFLKREGELYRVDNFGDEIVMGVETESGLFLILGCSHPGFINILESIKSRYGGKIYGLLGGTHLVNADKEWIYEVAAYLENSDIEIVATSHCTGDIAKRELKKRLSDRFRENMAGDGFTV